MQQIKFRDADGYLIRRDAPEPQCRKRQLIFCPESGGLKAIEHCNKCPLFKGMNTDYINCESDKPNTPPAYYDQPWRPKEIEHKPKKDKENGNRTDKTAAGQRETD